MVLKFSPYLPNVIMLTPPIKSKAPAAFVREIGSTGEPNMPK
jgi:hypothetical protein